MKVIAHNERTALENMLFDEACLQNLHEPLLHFYQWRGKSATYGYFIKPEEYLHLEEAKAFDITLAKRPTGGGIIFHLSDFTFSFLLPIDHPRFCLNTLENYAFVNELTARAISKAFPNIGKPSLLNPENECKSTFCSQFCMAHPTKYDLMIEGKKVGGSAQRRTKKGYLHQASIHLFPAPDELIIKVVKQNTVIARAIQTSSYSLLPAHGEKAMLEEARQSLQASLILTFQQMI